MVDRHHGVAEVRKVDHAGLARELERVVVGGGMSAGDDNAVRDQRPDASFRALQFGGEGNLSHG